MQLTKGPAYASGAFGRQKMARLRHKNSSRRSDTDMADLFWTVVKDLPRDSCSYGFVKDQGSKGERPILEID